MIHEVRSASSTSAGGGSDATNRELNSGEQRPERGECYRFSYTRFRNGRSLYGLEEFLLKCALLSGGAN